MHYFAAWTDSGCLLGCSHEHLTVSEAAACISFAGSYLVAVDKGVLRALTDEEEAEFQRANSATRTERLTAKPPQYEISGYAVMVRVKFVAGWGWTTWMRYDTYKQAAAHARQGNKVVRFGSPEWVALCRHVEPVLSVATNATARMRKHRQPAETLVEFLLRLLRPGFGGTYSADKERSTPARGERNELENASESLIERVLDWINGWEVKMLQRLHSLQMPRQLEGLRTRIRKALKHETGTR